ncbi:MAG: phenylalanine--tRNA ligase subunit beta [Planctomycetaceae bacterium]|nr:phenylalanine--tRNA ligase subunit beta [Planctomycetaceae bacterium]
MIVSWNWLKEYVNLDMPAAELERRLMFAGLNHESTADVAGDLAIDLEVTSNRADCLGHLGIAREVAVLWERELKVPAAQPVAQGPAAETLVRVKIEAPQLCSRYTARVIRGVKVGPSPSWLTRRLATIGIAAINNVVDITNYVLMECGQPLHAFDFQKLAGGEIIVREPRAGEKLEAIDHKTYELGPGMCVIADARQPVAIGGIMGGAATEVSSATTELLIEAALFDPLAIRQAARQLGLHSDSSYRFERAIDPQGVDWASRRACELILELCGGELAAGVVDVGQPPAARTPITLRFSQLKRVLGIEIEPSIAQRILQALGGEVRRSDAEHIEVVPPSWRQDLTREIDLVEEVARIHGYDKIPEDVAVPMAASARSRDDRILTTVRQALTAQGFDEAMTLSTVEEPLSEAYTPWTSAPALQSLTPVLRRADRLRRSLIPSLLAARRINETLANHTIELFEIAKIYLPQTAGLPREERMLGLTSGGGFLELKGVLEAILAALHIAEPLAVANSSDPLFQAGRYVELRLGNDTLGYLGELAPAGRKRFELRGPATAAELRLALLSERAQIVPQYVKPSAFPSIARDLNFVVDERVRWADLAAAVREAGGPRLTACDYQGTYRDPQRLGAGKKSLLLSIALGDETATLTNEQADALRDQIVAACHQKLGAELRGTETAG